MASVPKPKIYFCGSIRGAAVDKGMLRALIRHLKTHGPVLTEHVGEDVPEPKPVTDHEIYSRDCAWMRESDLVVAECSAASLGVGYELAYVEALPSKPPVLCLYCTRQEKALSGMIAGNPHYRCRYYETEAEALKHIDEFMAECGGGKK